MALTDQLRREAVGYLTVNCDCFAGAGKLLANKEVFSDEQLIKLVKNTKKAKDDALVANAARTGVRIAGQTLVFNSAGQAVFNGDNDANHSSSGSSGGTSVEQNDSALLKEEVDSSVEGSVDVGGSLKKGGVPGATNNAAFQAWLRTAPPEFQGAVGRLIANENNEKERLIRLLVANVRDETVKARLVANHRKKLLPQLQDEAAQLPAYLRPIANLGALQLAPEPVYGARPEPAVTDNADGGDQDILPITNMWEDAAEEAADRRARA